MNAPTHDSYEEKLWRRVSAAAEAALADHSYVSAIDVLVGTGVLAPSNLAAWRGGRIGCLEESIQAHPSKISTMMEMFRRWAAERGLSASEARYARPSRNGSVDLRFTITGDPLIEENYRTHFVSSQLSEQKRERLQEKLAKDPEPVVFEILRDSECSECGTELMRDSFLTMDAGQPLCLACANLGELEYLPAGDTAMTRRAKKYSSKVAVVVRFSRARKRYERQGILVEPDALEKAEASCADDANERAAQRKRAAEQRQKEDRRLVIRITEQILAMFPRCPQRQAQAIANHTALRGSGRVGRSEAGRKLDARALTLAVRAAVRHQHTNYDELLARGLDRDMARDMVADQIDSMLDSWR